MNLIELQHALSQLRLGAAWRLCSKHTSGKPKPRPWRPLI